MFLSIDNRDLHLLEPEATGDEGEPSLLFIHGAGGNAAVWASQTSYFHGRHLAYGIDLPGHGRSSPNGEASIAAYARWVRRAVAGAFPDTPLVLVGHSMGGAIAQALALDPFSNLKALALIGTGAKLGVMPEIFEMLDGDPEAFFGSIGTASFHPDTPRAVRDAFERLMRQCPLPTLTGDFRACDAFDVRDRLGEIRLPCLVLCGERDKLTRVAYSTYLHEHLGVSTLRVIPGAGHNVMVEKPGDVYQALADFLDSLSL